MDYQNRFRRYESKYILTCSQQELLLEAIGRYMRPDRYGPTTVRNIYFDTDTYRLIRHSLEKPVYKEKLRLRSYTQIRSDMPVFVELKKKYRGVVYKRRLAMPEGQALDWLAGRGSGPPESQISREIAYFRDYYAALRPMVFLSYDRQAYVCEDSDLRVTFDENILCRQNGLSLAEPPGGQAILPQGQVLMEIKTMGGIPLWMTRLLGQAGIYKTSYSKYGTAYQTMIPDPKILV